VGLPRLGDPARQSVARGSGDIHLAYIPETFSAQQKKEISNEYMRPLSQLGYHLAKNDYACATKKV
jgi:hypothetical protein